MDDLNGKEDVQMAENDQFSAVLPPSDDINIDRSYLRDDHDEGILITENVKTSKKKRGKNMPN